MPSRADVFEFRVPRGFLGDLESCFLTELCKASNYGLRVCLRAWWLSEECLGVTLGDFLFALQKEIELPELADPESGRHITHAIVVAYLIVVELDIIGFCCRAQMPRKLC